MVMDIQVLTPDRVICTSLANEVILPSMTGLVGVLDGHATLVTALDTGLLRIKLEETWTPIILCGGLAEIDRNRVTVLVNSVEEFNEIDELRDVTKELEAARLAVLNSIEQSIKQNDESKNEVNDETDSKELLDVSIELKKAQARVEGIKYLSKK